MKRKHKRKKDSNSPNTPDISRKEVSERKGTENSQDENRNTSRSSSRRRRSLSSLFRRSRDRQRRDRSESSDRSKSRGTSSGGAELSDVLAFNPRTEPRDHLRRMTVREALAESRTRGRSPNRRAIYNLEKRIMPSGLENDISSEKSLSTSLPHIPDAIQTGVSEQTEITGDESEKVMTLNRPGKKRGLSEGRINLNDTKNNSHDSRNKDNFLPLDKRKYIISKDKTSVLTDSTEPLIPPTNLVHKAEVHSPHSSRDPSPYSGAAFANQERHRRESFAKFLQLRDTRPPRSTSNLSIGRLSADSLDSSDDHQILLHSLPEPRYVPLGNVSVLEDGTKVVLPTYDQAMAEPTYPSGRRVLSISPSSRFQPINAPVGAKSRPANTNTGNSPLNDLPKRDRQKREGKSIRSNYVSPRRFTKGSRKDNSTNHSNEVQKPVEEVVKVDNTQNQLESAPGKYQRKFSSSSEKSRRKLSNQSNSSGVDTDKVDGNTFHVIQPTESEFQSQRSKIENLSELYNNDIKYPQPKTAKLTRPQSNTDNIKRVETNDSIEESDNYEINTGLTDMANRIHEAMKTVNSESLLTQFPNTDCTAIPLENITNDVPFKSRTDSQKSVSNSHSKSSSASKRLSSNSEFGPVNVDSVEDLLMQDDVFETNIDEISLKSEEKPIDSPNKTPSDKLDIIQKPEDDETMRTDSRQISENGKPEETITNETPYEKQIDQNVKEVVSKKESKKKKKRKSKSENNEDDIEEALIAHEGKSGDKKKKTKRSKKERKKGKSKNRSLSDLGADVDKLNEVEDDRVLDKQFENDKIVKVEETDVRDSKTFKSKTSKRKSFFRRTKRSPSRTPSVKDALVKVGRAASLSNILDTPELSRAARKPSLVKTDSLKRSHSVEELSTLKYNKIEQPLDLNIPDSIFNRRSAKDAIWNIETELPKPKEKKSQPKLSLSAIISLRAKVGRYKKAKQAREREEAAKLAAANEHDVSKTEESVVTNKDTQNENSEACDREVANIVYENEMNVSLNKQQDPNVETALIGDDLDNEIANIVHEKKIHFDSYINEQHISEEEMIKQRQRNTRLTGRRESKVRQRQKKVISCCKKLIAFLFSHIGLCSLVVAYCIAGGFIFKNLEGSNELEKKLEMQTVREDFTNQIFSLAFQNKFTKRSAQEFKIRVKEILKNYSQTIYRETKEAGWDGKDYSNEPEQWSFPSSLLYAITVMTTIGYGHVAPKTPVGRIVTIGYAVLGIPLTLLCLTNIGDVMAKGFRMLYGKVFCGLCCVLFRPSRKRRLHDPEKGIPAGEERMVVQEEEKLEEIIHVPTSVCLLLMSAYVLLGTWAFCEWEGWDMVTGTYFCFITLSTIGFGDVVPGMTSDKWDMNEKLVLCALYLILGLSLIAMCFNLVQEDVKAKCKWLGMKLGIIDKPVTAV